jgi:outer membrane receptor for ferrienterochelin and colicin
MNKIFLLLLFIMVSYIALAQQKFTISGHITDSADNEGLIGATIVDPLSLKGTVANNYGFYSITLPAGKFKLAFSFVGYETQFREIVLTKDQIMNLSLATKNELEEVQVVGAKANASLTTTQMSRFDMSIEKIKSLPAIMGEADVIKSLQLLPGVKSGSEGSTGLYVRGGGPDQNLVLLDGVPVYNANHLFGFFSVFNPDALKTVSLYKGGFPARFGGRLSSVIDVRMKEGNEKEFHGNISLGLISSKFNLEGPIVKERTAFSISARRTYLDMLTTPIQKIINKGDYTGYYFYDMNVKINHRFSDRSRLFLSSYLGKDNLYSRSSSDGSSPDGRRIEKGEEGLDWGNVTTALRWNYLFNNKLFSNSTITYSRYKFKVGNENQINLPGKGTSSFDKYEFGSGINDWAYKIDFDYFPSPDHAVKFGANYIYHSFRPGVKTFQTDSEDSTAIDKVFGDKNINASDFSVYAEDDITLGARLKANVGLHASAFNVQNTFYTSLEPRLSVNYMAGHNLSFKASYSRMKQYIHLLTSSSFSLPTDLWVPVTKKIRPMTAEQVAVGAVYRLADGLDLTVEGFYKKMNNLIEYKEGASFFGASNGWEDKVESGKGWAYGSEVMISKEIGKTTGWIGYTLSWADRQFENVSFGKKFPARYDSRHDITIVLSHKFNDKVDIGSNWCYRTGNAVTLSTQQINADIPYADNRFIIDYFDGRNNYRMPSYHRLDFGINFHKQKRRGVRTWNISIYNLYNRQNPLSLFLETNNQGEHVLMQTSLFSVIPSFTYSFKF